MAARITRALSRASSLLLVLCLCSCADTVYHDFCNVEDGWKSNDTLVFRLCNARAASEVCDAYIELRTTPGYPYRKLWLSACVRGSSGGVGVTDTLCCEIFDSLGQQIGPTAGLLYQTGYRLTQLELPSADTVTVSIAHIMSGEVNGVRSVGVRAVRCGRHLP